MESAMWYCLAAVTMFSPRILREQIYRLYRTINAAKESSEYQVEKLLAALKPNPKTSSAKKTKAKEAKDDKGAEVKEKKEVKAVKKSTKEKAKKSASGSKSSKQK